MVDELFVVELFVDWLLLVVPSDFCVVPELLVVCVLVVGLLSWSWEPPSTSGSSPPGCCSSEPWSSPPPAPAVGVAVAWFVAVGVAVGVGFFWSSTHAW